MLGFFGKWVVVVGKTSGEITKSCFKTTFVFGKYWKLPIRKTGGNERNSFQIYFLVSWCVG